MQIFVLFSDVTVVLSLILTNTDDRSDNVLPAITTFYGNDTDADTDCYLRFPVNFLAHQTVIN